MDFVDGIYLEEKKSSIGTGVTASSVTFRNYFAVFARGDNAVVFLLDDDLGLTSVCEKGPLAKYAGRLNHQPDLQGRFDEVKADLAQRAARKTAPTPPPEAPAKPEPKPTQQAAPTRPAAPAPAPAKAEPAAGGWWDLTSRGSEHLLKK